MPLLRKKMQKKIKSRGKAGLREPSVRNRRFLRARGRKPSRRSPFGLLKAAWPVVTSPGIDELGSVTAVCDAEDGVLPSLSASAVGPTLAN